MAGLSAPRGSFSLYLMSPLASPTRLSSCNHLSSILLPSSMGIAMICSEESCESDLFRDCSAASKLADATSDCIDDPFFRLMGELKLWFSPNSKLPAATYESTSGAAFDSSFYSSDQLDSDWLWSTLRLGCKGSYSTGFSYCKRSYSTGFSYKI